MKSFIKNYKSTIILLGSICIGGAAGVIFGPKAEVVKPLGDLFLNLMFMIIVPLVFFSVSSAIANMSSAKRFGKILGSIFIVFAITALIAAVIGLISALIANPFKGIDPKAFKNIMSQTGSANKQNEQVTFLGQVVNTFTVSDFAQLFTKGHILQLIVFSIIFGFAALLAGEKGKVISNFLSSGSEVMMKAINIIMYYAPIGLGCFFASVTSELGPQIIKGYVNAFILYIVFSIIYYFGFFTLYAYVAGGKKGVSVFWKNSIVPSVTALATCSSAACIPVNLVYTKKMGVPQDIAETLVPLGANIHKDGSVFGGILKLVFLFGIFGRSISGATTILGIIGTAFLVGAVMGAIPSGGMIGEMLIISVYGFPPEVLPIIAVISAIIDAPATLLNSTGNTVCAMMVSRIVEGKKWLKNY